MTGEHPAEHDNETSPEFKCYLAIARAMFIPAMLLAGAGALGGLIIVALGEVGCAKRALNLPYRTRDFLALPLVCLIALAMVRAMGYSSGEKLEQMTNSFELYNIPLFEAFSIKVTYSLLLFVAIVLGALAVLCIPIGMVFVDLKTIWSICAAASDIE